MIRTSPNAAPVREVLHSFLLSALVEGKRFSHVRWLMDDPAVATLMALERVRGEDAQPRLARELDPASLRAWMQRPQTELYAALPERFICRLGRDGQHPLRASGSRRRGLQPAQARAQEPSSA